MTGPCRFKVTSAVFFCSILLLIGLSPSSETVLGQNSKRVMRVQSGEPERIDLEEDGSSYEIQYKNKDGLVFRREKYDFEGLASTTDIYEIHPNENSSRVKVTKESEDSRSVEFVSYNQDGTPIEKQTLLFDGRNDLIEDKTEIWNSESSKWMPAPEAEKGSKVRDYDSTMRISSGLQTVTFSTPHGNIILNAGDDLFAGSSVSGSLYVKPKGRDKKAQNKNLEKLGNYSVDLGVKKIKSSSQTFEPFKLVVPKEAFGTQPLILTSEKGKKLTEAKFVILPGERNPSTEYKLQEVGQQGEPISLSGNFDGNSLNSAVKIGDEVVPIIAETRGKIVVYHSSTKTGMTDLQVFLDGNVITGKFRSTGITLSAPKLNLTKGEKTTLLVKVIGLSGIKNMLPLTLANKSPTVIRMANGDVQTLTISPEQVENGEFSIERQLTGIRRGSFTITGTVRADQPNVVKDCLNASDPTCVGRPCVRQIITIYPDAARNGKPQELAVKRVLMEVFTPDSNGDFDQARSLVYNEKSHENAAPGVGNFLDRLWLEMARDSKDVRIGFFMNESFGCTLASRFDVDECTCVIPDIVPKDPQGNDFPHIERKAGLGDEPLYLVIKRLVKNLTDQKTYLVAYHFKFAGSISTYSGFCEKLKPI